ncbi:MAG: homoserine dehydrogenase [Thermoprotei archaeon]|nr:MAG: homoserine dehydrogenase [Thermoprotei archaeon]RLF20326.1 MAG: homoserine dehydrogenase [Thermoprotei archaeon]
MRRVKLVISGFGNVGRALTRLILNKKEEVARRYGIIPTVLAVIDSRGAAVNINGFSDEELMKLLNTPRGGVSKVEYYGKPGLTTIEVLNEVDADMLVEATPTDYVTGAPGVENTFFAIDRGIHVVLANKAPLALRFREVMKKARAKNVMIGYKATVMAGTPLVDMLRYGLIAQRVRKIEGILNGSTNYILTEMHKHRITLEEAMRRAQELGILEADPTLDIDGWDPAAKIVIVVNTIFNANYTVNDVERISLREVSLNDIEKALSRGGVVKYLAIASVHDEEIMMSVKPILIDKTHELAHVNGTYNGVLIETDVNRIFLSGKGAGPKETASVMLSDIIQIADTSLRYMV